MSSNGRSYNPMSMLSCREGLECLDQDVVKVVGNRSAAGAVGAYQLGAGFGHTAATGAQNLQKVHDLRLVCDVGQNGLLVHDLGDGCHAPGMDRIRKKGKPLLGVFARKVDICQSSASISSSREASRPSSAPSSRVAIRVTRSRSWTCSRNRSSGASTPNSSRSRVTTWMAVSESPPAAKYVWSRSCGPRRSSAASSSCATSSALTGPPATSLAALTPPARTTSAASAALSTLGTPLVVAPLAWSMLLAESAPTVRVDPPVGDPTAAEEGGVPGRCSAPWLSPANG